MTKLVVTLRNFSNALKNYAFCPHNLLMCYVFISEKTAIIFVFKIYCQYIILLPVRRVCCAV